MEIKQLRQFVAVVEARNLSKAAHVVHLTQPALTRSIKNLEEQLGTELLERRPKGVIPTEAGESLYLLAQIILNQTRRAEQHIRSIASGEQGKIDFGVSAMFANTIVDDVIIEILDLYPGLSFTLQVGFFERLVSDLRKGRLDLVFSNFPPAQMPAGVQLEPLITIRSHFVAGASHPLAKKSKVSVRDLSTAHWVNNNQPHTVDFLSRFFAEAGFAPKAPIIETTSLVALRSLVRTGQFLSILPEHWISNEVQSGEIRILKVPGSPLIRKAGIIVRDGEPARAAVKNFIEIVRKTCKKWPDLKE
jgi:DNA-binding transcriptional LysR family regulator